LQGDDHGTKEGKVRLFKQSTDLCAFGKPSATPTGNVEVGWGRVGCWKISSPVADCKTPGGWTYVINISTCFRASKAFAEKLRFLLRLFKERESKN